MMMDFCTRLLWSVLLYGAFCILQRLLRKVRLVHRAAGELNLFCLVAIVLYLFADRLAALHPNVLTGVQTATIFLALHLLIRTLDVWLFEFLLPRHRQTPVPVVLRDIGRWLITVMVLVGVVRLMFPNINLNVLAVSSIVVGYILGNATQETLGHLFAGLSLNTERPFQIGDWVLVGGHTGQVVDMSWRATRLRTKMEDHIIIPNASISREPIINYSRPTKLHGCTLDIGVSYETPPNKARRAILEVLRDCPEILKTPAPLVRLVSYADFSINFVVKFFIDDFERLESIRSLAMDRIWYAFKREGITIPFPIRDVRMRSLTAEDDARDRAAAARERMTRLAGIDLFAPLPEADRAAIADGMHEEVYSQGEDLVRQGETGRTFYIVTAGRLQVKAIRDGHAVVLGHLGLGDFFGEMSMLTGEARSATVTAETDASVLAVSHDLLKPLLARNEALAGEFARVLEERQKAKTIADLSSPRAGGAPAATASYSVLLGRIRRFFALG